MRLVLGLVLYGLLITGLAPDSHAQAYPSRPVRIIIPLTAGGGVDTTARILAPKLSESTGQMFVVDNRPGAGGNIAFELVSRSEPDGYTILASTPGIVINPTLYRKVNYKVEDFIAVSLIGKAALLIVVHPSLPVRSISDLVKLAKAKPDAIRFSSAGIGSTSHLAGEVFRMMAGIQMVHVPYKGGPQALQDVISGQLEMAAMALAQTLTQVRAGRVRALAQTGEKRSLVMPDVPTMDEAGITGYAVYTWHVFFGPAGMPRDGINKLHAELTRALKLADVQERLRTAGMDEIVGSTPEQAAQFVKAEFERWAKVIQASGARAD